MKDYLLVILATILQALDFALLKQYQRKAGTSPTAGLIFNAFSGLFIALLLWAVKGFRITVLPFSALVAAALGILLISYTLIGFRIMKAGGMAYYTLFLMTGGMCVPYVWGLLFLNEPFSWLGMGGLGLIIAAVALSNTGAGHPSWKLLLPCVALFFLNGFVSVLNKLHQVERLHQTVGATDFVILVGFARFVLCTLSLAVIKCRSRGGEDPLPLPAAVRFLPLILVEAVVSSASYTLQLIGAENLPASVLFPIVTGGTIIFSALAGLIFFREYPRRVQWIGIGLCFIGTCLFL